MKNFSTKTKAIIIKRINFKDQDKIVTLYTKELGKIAVIARGIRKLESKRKSHFELGNLIKIDLIESHKFYIATQTEIIKTHPKLKLSLERVNALYYILEVFDGLTPEKDDNAILFKFLEKTLDILEIIDEKKITDFLNAYSLKVLRMSGFLNDPLEILHTKTNKEYYENITNLINKTYEEIIIQPNEDFLSGEMFNLIKIYAESVLERKIKSGQ